MPYRMKASNIRIGAYRTEPVTNDPESGNLGRLRFHGQHFSV